MDQEPQIFLSDIEDEDLPESWQRQIRDMYDAIKLVHKKAIAEDYNGFNGQDIVEINRTVVENEFLLNPHLYGQVRKGNVSIANTIKGKRVEASFKPVDAKELPYIYEDFSKKLKEKSAEISSDSTVAEVLDTAAWTSIELVRIHPFLDGNKRTSRLLVDLLFARANLPYITDWGSKNDEYLETLYETYKQLNPDIFKMFLARKLRKSLVDLEKVGSGVAEYVKDTKQQVDNYVENLKRKK